MGGAFCGNYITQRRMDMKKLLVLKGITEIQITVPEICLSTR